MRQKKLYLLLWTFILILGASLIVTIKLNIFAKEPETPDYIPYYKSVLLEEGDSLWSLAAEYSSSTPYTIAEYISQLRSINGLSDDTIHTGCYLTIVYYEKVQDNPD